MTAKINLTDQLGRLILKECKIDGVVTYVDLTIENQRGFSEYTPGWTEYPVIVHYTGPDGKHRKYTKTYESMTKIVQILSDLADDVYDDGEDD